MSRRAGGWIVAAAGGALALLVILAILVGRDPGGRPPAGATGPGPAPVARADAGAGPTVAITRRGRPPGGGGAAATGPAGEADPGVRDHRRGDAGAPDPATPQVTARVRAAGQPEVRRCAHALAKRRPGVTGQVVLSFTLRTEQGRGAISDVQVAGDTFDDEEFVACLAEAMTRAAVEVPEAGTSERRVSMPFTIP